MCLTLPVLACSEKITVSSAETGVFGNRRAGVFGPSPCNGAEGLKIDF